MLLRLTVTKEMYRLGGRGPAHRSKVRKEVTVLWPTMASAGAVIDDKVIFASP